METELEGVNQPGFLLLPAVEAVCDIQMGWGRLGSVCLPWDHPRRRHSNSWSCFPKQLSSTEPPDCGRASEGVEPCVFTFKGAVLELSNIHGEI